MYVRMDVGVFVKSYEKKCEMSMLWEITISGDIFVENHLESSCYFCQMAFCFAFFVPSAATICFCCKIIE